MDIYNLRSIFGLLPLATISYCNILIDPVVKTQENNNISTYKRNIAKNLSTDLRIELFRLNAIYEQNIEDYSMHYAVYLVQKFILDLVDKEILYQDISPWTISETLSINNPLLLPVTDDHIISIDNTQITASEELCVGILQGLKIHKVTLYGVTLDNTFLLHKYTNFPTTNFMPYGIVINGKILYFLTTQFIRGFLSACMSENIDPSTISNNLGRYFNNKLETPLGYDI